MLVWKPGTPVAAKQVHRRSLRRIPQAQERYGYLLDGQQRLTALLLVREQDDEFPLIYYAWPGAEQDGDKRFYWRHRNEVPNPWSIPVADALHDGFDVAAKLAELRDDPEWKPEHEGPVLAGLTALAAIRSYPVGVLEFETDDYRKATELFVRFNSTGRKLRRGDLAMARLAIDLPDLASSRIRPAAEKWKAMGFTAPFLVQCLLAVHTGRFQMREPEELWADADSAQVRELWRKTERAVDRLVTFLTGTVKWGAGREIPSLTALVPLVYLLADGRPWSREQLLVARRWLRTREPARLLQRRVTDHPRQGAQGARRRSDAGEAVVLHQAGSAETVGRGLPNRSDRRPDDVTLPLDAARWEGEGLGRRPRIS